MPLFLSETAIICPSETLSPGFTSHLQSAFTSCFKGTMTEFGTNPFTVFLYIFFFSGLIFGNTVILPLVAQQCTFPVFVQYRKTAQCRMIVSE